MKKKILQFSFIRVTLIIFLFFLMVSSVDCKKSDAQSQIPENEVWIQNYTYSPSTITVSSNTTIKWTNKDAVDHTVTSDSSIFDSGSISTSGTFSYTFTTPGTYPYHCTIHPYMKATVIVN